MVIPTTTQNIRQTNDQDTDIKTHSPICSRFSLPRASRKCHKDTDKELNPTISHTTNSLEMEQFPDKDINPDREVCIVAFIIECVITTVSVYFTSLLFRVL